MKSKKILSIVLCIGIAASSLGSSLTGYAKVAKNKSDFDKQEAVMDNSSISTLPSQNLLDMEAEVYDQSKAPSDKLVLSSEEEILYQGTIAALNPEDRDMFHIGEEEIEDMMKKGYSIEDIFEADRISNELFIDPVILLEEKMDSNKSLEEVKSEILEENRKKVIFNLKDKFGDQYKKLKEMNLEETDIINLLAYSDINNVEISDVLIEEYQRSSDSVLQRRTDDKIEDNALQDEGERSRLSESETMAVPEKLKNKLDVLSEKTGKSVEDLINAYLKGRDN